MKMRETKKTGAQHFYSILQKRDLSFTTKASHPWCPGVPVGVLVSWCPSPCPDPPVTFRCLPRNVKKQPKGF